MLRRLERAAREHRPDAKILRAPAEDLPFDDHSFDVAVSTLVLCGVDDQPRALRELRRVLRPGGRLLFIEHLRSGDPGTARLQDASGDVIEIGGGTGLNLSCYGPAVRSLTITEPEPAMLRRLEGKVRAERPDAKVLRAPAEHLRSGDPATARLQDRLNWLNRLVVCCDCNRPTLDSIRAAGFTVTQVEHTELPKAPPFVRPTVLGSATVPAAAPRAPQDGARPTVAPPQVARPAG